MQAILNLSGLISVGPGAGHGSSVEPKQVLLRLPSILSAGEAIKPRMGCTHAALKSTPPT